MKHSNKALSLSITSIIFFSFLNKASAMTAEEWVQVIKAASESSHHSILELKGRTDAFHKHNTKLTPTIVGALIDENKKEFDSILK
ncbi:MAG: hypothetical protein WCK43_02795, partial [bacterium]